MNVLGYRIQLLIIMTTIITIKTRPEKTIEYNIRKRQRRNEAC